ncbi:MAG TPA: serine/threonine-protein kinase [Roseiflexaceae bacterium]|nr:serine/threonine-protein kinase [Roseiflexaceae bacterium]
MLTPFNILGARIGAYEVQALIGSGGMASVYRGFDHNLQRPVAIKVLSDAAAAQPGFVERFRQEARLIARLRHPHIVHVYDFGVEGRVVYMVQELLPGPTLAQRLKELAARGQPMPRREIVAVLRQLADALDAAHAAGIIHRDVKPANVLFRTSGDGAPPPSPPDPHVVLTDFGIAKATTGDGTQTQTGMVLGTPVYVSPEQARGEPLTPASDIYALGVVLYELIGGRPPFEGDTPLGIVLRHLQEAPPPLQPLRASVPPAVEAVVRRALAKQPEERFTSAGELARALEAAWPGPGAAASAPAPADIHTLPTTAWQRPQTRTAGGPGTDNRGPKPALSASEGTDAASAPYSAAPRVSGTQHAARSTQHAAPRHRSTLPVLGVLLAVLLLVGVVLAALGGRERTGAGGTLAAATAVPTAPAAGGGPPPATAGPATPAAGGTDAPAAGTSLGRLRGLLGEPDPVLAASLDAAERALASGDRDGATAALTSLQLQLIQGRRAGRLSPAQLRAALAEIQAAAEAHEITLALQVGT